MSACARGASADAERGGRCPAPFAPRDECLDLDEQFRTLATLAYHGPRQRVTLSYQRQHERRSLDRPSSFARNGGRDDVDSFGLMWKGRGPTWAVGDAALSLRYGADGTDRVGDAAWSELTDIDTVIRHSRGQYLWTA